MKRLVIGLTSILLLIGLNACSGSDSTEIEFLKNEKLDICPNATIEQMLNEGISSPTWEYNKEKGYITVSGDIYFEGHEAKGLVQFDVDTERKTFQYSAFEFNGKIQDNGTANAFFNYICPEVNNNQSSQSLKKQKIKKPQESPIRISAERAYNKIWNFYYPKIIITSIVDNITIDNVTVNKGHCKYPNTDIIYVNGRMKTIKLVPRKLKYSEQLEIRLNQSCNLLRVDISTNQGDWSVEY